MENKSKIISHLELGIQMNLISKDDIIEFIETISDDVLFEAARNIDFEPDYESAEFDIDYNNRLTLQNVDMNAEDAIREMSDMFSRELKKYLNVKS